MISSCKEKGTNARDIGHQKDLDLMTNLLTTQVEFIDEIREKKWFPILESRGTE